MFSLFRRKTDDYFSSEEKEKILSAIQKAEQTTSGEIRVYVEKRCRFVDAIDRAAEVFYSLKMEQTVYRNATLIYVAFKDRQIAVFGDEGIYAKTGKEFWNEAVKKMIKNFNRENYTQGIVEVIEQIGAALSHHFPYDAATDKNELPDDIVFGK